MRKKLGNTVLVICVMLLLPYALTILLNGKMEEIYRKIQDQAAYILVETDRGIQEMNMEEYIIGVTATQIPLEYELEAVKAQMVIARTNLLYEMQDGKVWDGSYFTLAELELEGVSDKFLQAQRETQGEYMMYNGKTIMASYHALSAGQTRDGQEVFRTDGYEYLKSKKCPSDKKAENYKMEVQISEQWKGLEIVKRDSAGYVQQLKLDGTSFSGEEFRKLLGLASSNFQIEERTEGMFLTSFGMGHGFGLSQFTAQELALSGKNYREILLYFYEGVEIAR